jgi:hypothetical protein
VKLVSGRITLYILCFYTSNSTFKLLFREFLYIGITSTTKTEKNQIVICLHIATSGRHADHVNILFENIDASGLEVNSEKISIW